MFIESPPPTIENSPPVDAEAVELAQAGTGVAAAIGKVSSVIGTVFITHPDGTRVQATDGMPILQGDVIETTGDGAIGITFIDESTFSLAEEGRMTIDEMVYDANTQTGRAVFGIAEGVFTFVSGQIAKTAVDAMIINTPLATIGIRGTAGGGKAGPEGTLNTYSMFGEEGGAVGEMVIKTLGGTQTLNGINQTTQFSNAYVPPTIPVALPAAATQAFYGSAAAAAPQPVIAAPPTFAPGSAEANAAEAAQAAFQATIDAGGSLDSAISGAVDGAAKSNFEAVLAADPLFFGTTAAHNSVIEGERGEIIGKVAGTRGDPLGAGKGDGPGYSQDAKDAADHGLGNVLESDLADAIEGVLDSIELGTDILLEGLGFILDDIFEEIFFDDFTDQFFEFFFDDPFEDIFGFDDPFDEFSGFEEEFFFITDVFFEEDLFFEAAFFFEADIDDFFEEELIFFGDFFDLTSGDDILLGGAGNTEFILDQGLFGSSVFGGNDVINDAGGTRDRITFEGLDNVVISMTGDSGDATRVEIKVATLSGPLNITNTSGVTSPLSSPVNIIDISKDVEDLQALDSDFTDFDSGGVLLLGALDVTSSQTGYIVAGSTANDVIDMSGFNTSATIGSILFGKGGDDTLTGTVSADDLEGGAGNDILDAKGGINFVEGGTGTDTINVTVASSSNTIDGEGGTDTLNYTSLSNVTTYNFGTTGSLALTRSGGGNDLVSGIEILNAGSGADIFNFNTLSLGFTIINGGGGNDTFTFNTANADIAAKIDGGDDTDSIVLNAATALGGSGGVKNVESVTGSSGNDSIDFVGAQSGVTVDLSGGTDTVILDNTTNSLTITNTETITGGTGADTITVNAANMEGIASTFNGGSGTDNLIITATAAANLDATELNAVTEWETWTLGSDQAYTLTLSANNVAAGVELQITGSANVTTAANAITIDASAVTSGGATSVKLIGGAGNDIFTGSAGNDVFTGGAGADTINVGSGGADLVAYTASTEGSAITTITETSGDADNFAAVGGTNVDSITNAFAVASDKIEFSGALLTAIGGTVDAADSSASLNYSNTTVFVIRTAEAKLLGTNFGDVTDVITAFNTANGTAINSTGTEQILFTVENSTNTKTGLYFFEDVNNNNEMDIGDKIALLAVIDVVSLTTTEFAAG